MEKKTKQTDYAYIAGYIDGDGCFNIERRIVKYVMSFKFPQAIIISSVNMEVLEWCKSNWGGSIHTQKIVPKNNKPLHRYTLRKFRAIPFTKKTLPHLVEKIEEADIFLRFANSKCNAERFKLISKIKIIKDVSNLVSKHHKKEFEQYKNTIKPSEEDFAYLSGFIDAECSLNIQKYKPKERPNYVYKIILQCNNTKAPIFKWLLERFSGQIHFIDRLTHQKARKNQLTWRLSGKALSKLLPKIYPFLKHKKPVCEALIDFYNTTLPNGGARHTEIFRSQYADVIKIREEIVTKVHKLNLKGTKTV